MSFDLFKKNKNKDQDNNAIAEQEVAINEEQISSSNDTEEKQAEKNASQESNEEQKFDENGNPLDENGEPIIFPPPQIKVIISNDRLTAYVRVTLSDKLQPFKEEQVYYALEQNDVIFGIDSDAIKEFVTNRHFFSDLIAARGIRQIDGIDGQIDYLVKTDKEICLTETEDGTVDFRELNATESVNADEVLAIIQPSTEGTEGTDIFGNPIPPTNGKDADIKIGENVYISEDGFTVKASIAGMVEFNKDVISISRVYV
ncbi:MAG: FapA family protein, partial [Oscillospiraceae bacterium]